MRSIRDRFANRGPLLKGAIMPLSDTRPARLIDHRDKLRAELPGLPVGTMERVYKQREIVQVEADINRYLS